MEAMGVAWVTGGGRGLGRALVLELAKRGFEVVAGVRRPEACADLVAAAPTGRIRVERLDVTDPDSIRVPAGLRVLVNNAGADAAYLPVEHFPMDHWRDVFETNFFGLVEVTRRAIPVMREAGGGVLCNITSASLFAPVPFFAAYRASKAAVAALGDSLRAELAAFGIRVLEVTPGPVETDMLRDSDRRPEAAAYPLYRAQADRYHASRKAVEAHVTPAEVAAAAIADAILDDDAPQRVSCDALGAGMLAGFEQGPDEARQRALIAAFLPKDPD